MSAVDVPARRFFLLVLAFLLVALLPFPTLAQDVWVNKDTTPVDIGGQTIDEPGHNDNAGTAADTPVRTLTRALDIAQSDSTVYVGPGVYGETITINLTNVSLIAGGPDTTIIRDTGLTDSLGVEVTGDSVTIENFSIEDFDNEGILADGATNLTLENLAVLNTGDTGIGLMGLSNATADSIVVRNNDGFGFSVINSNNNQINDVVSDNNDYGFFLNGSSNTRLNSDTAVNNENFGVRIRDSNGDTLTNASIRDNGLDGVQVTGSSSVRLQNLEVVNSDGDGVGIYGTDNIQIENVRSRNNSAVPVNKGDGFFVDSSDSVSLVDNRSLNNELLGLEVLSSSGGRFLRNLVAGNDDGGVRFNDSSGSVFEQNELRNDDDNNALTVDGSTDFDTLVHNNFLNLNNNIVNNPPDTISMTSNYWNSSDSSAINGVTTGDIVYRPYRLTPIDTQTMNPLDQSAPKSPDQLSADTSVPDKIVLTWNKRSGRQDGTNNSRSKGFRVYRSTDATITDWKNEADRIFKIDDSSDSELTDTNVVAGQTYHYRVTTYDSHLRDSRLYENEGYFSGSVDAAAEDFGPEIYVNDDSETGDVFTTTTGDDSKNGTPQHPLRTIQRAVDVSQQGDTIFVDSGTYTDTTTVDTAGVAIVGAGHDNTIFDVTYSGAAFRVTQNNASGRNLLKNFTVRDAVTGIALEGSDVSHVMNVEVRGSTTGISSLSGNNRITNNRLWGNQVGLRLSTATDNLVAQNEFDTNFRYQVVTDGSGNVRRNNFLAPSGNSDSVVNGPSGDFTYNWWNATDSTVIRTRADTTDYIPHRLGFVDTGVGADSVAPASPSNVTVDTSVAREITLRWDEPTTREDGSNFPGSPQGYNIYRLENERDTDDWTLHHRATIDPSDTDFTDSSANIDKDEGYFYRITSFDTNDSGVFNESYFTDVHAGTWVNRVPRAGTATVETQVDSRVSFSLTGSDSDADTLAYSIVSGPDSGTLDTAPRSGGSGIDTAVTYRPDTPYVGTDSFRFTVSDGDGGVDTGTITIETLVETSIRVERFRVDGQDTPLVAGRGDTFEARVRFNNTKSGPGEVSLDTSALEIRDGLGNVVNDSFNVTRAGTDVRVNGNDTAVGRWVVDYPQSNEPQLHGNFRVVLDFNDMTVQNVFQGNVKDVGDSLASNSRTLNVLPEPIEADQTPDDFGLDTGGVNVQSVELDLGIVNDDAVLDTDAAGVTDGDSIFRMIQRGDTASIDTPIANPNYGFASPDEFDTDLAEAYGDLRELTETEAGFSTRNLKILSNNLLSITIWRNEVLSDSNFISPNAYLGDSDVLREESEVTVRNVAFNGKPERLRVIKLLPRDGSGSWRWTLVDNLDGEVDGIPKVTGEEGNYTVRFEVSEDTGFSVFQVIASGVVKDAPANDAVVYPNPFVPHDGTERTGCYQTNPDCDDDERWGIFFGAGPDRGFPAGSRIKIYNVKGEMIDEFTLFNGGIFQWDARTRNGERVASGVYIYRIETPDGTDRNGKFAIVR